MKRRSAFESDSLELLLDTICNTFGGILFVAVLVAILIRFSSSAIRAQRVAPDETGKPTAADAADRLADLQSLQRAMAEHQATMDKLDADETSELYQRAVVLHRTVDQLTQQRATLVMQLATIERENTATKEQRDRTISDVSRAQREETELVQRLQRERKKHTRTARLPSLRATAKQEFPIVMRFGRVYFPYAPDANVVLGGLQLDGFDVLNDRDDRKGGYLVLNRNNNMIHVAPDPTAGIAVDGSEKAADAIAKTLIPLDKQMAYIAIGVWEDSFEEFAQLKDVVVERGFEYRLLPLREDDFIGTAPRGDAKVQ